MVGGTQCSSEISVLIAAMIDLLASTHCLFFCFFCFVALRPKSTAMIMPGRSVDLTTPFPGQA